MLIEIKMSGECDKCGEHSLECACDWNKTEKGKQQLLDIINDKFSFGKDGTIYCLECKNESVACVCMNDEDT